MATRKLLTAGELLQGAASAAVRSWYARAVEGDLPTPDEMIRDVGQLALGQLVAAQQAPDDAPDTERRPYVDTSGVSL